MECKTKTSTLIKTFQIKIDGITEYNVSEYWLAVKILKSQHRKEMKGMTKE